ncbi:proline-rich protein 12-like [Homarus americanus]|uniref:proline-rich protein 12-like n=1 Tax=Homarus americanus TaxID=6706 RepID=UPI001C4965E6|nr:proline-rich protein 12-like [Homarus americanus]
MRLVVLVLAVAVTVTHAEELTRDKRSIGKWFSGLFKGWKKESEDDYGPRPIITVPVPHPRPVYHPPVVKHYYRPPPVHIKPTYGPPPPRYGGGGGGGHFAGGHFAGGHGGGSHFTGGFGGGGNGGGGHGGGGHFAGGHGGGGRIKGGLGGGGHIKGGLGGGGHIKGGHGGGGHIKGGHGGGGHVKGGLGGGGHIKGGHGGGGQIKGGHGGGGHGEGIPHGFGPVKHSDVVHSGGGSYSPPPPPVDSYAPPPPVDSYGPPPVDSYGPPPVDSYGPPPIDSYGPPPVDSYAPPPVDNYAPPLPGDSYSAPSVPIVPVVPQVLGDSYSPPVVPVGPVVPDLSNEYRAPPSFPPPMAAHGSSSSSYLGFQPSQPLPIESLIPVAPVGPPAPLYDLPSASGGGALGGGSLGLGGLGGGALGLGGLGGGALGGGALGGGALPPAQLDIFPPGGDSRGAFGSDGNFEVTGNFGGGGGLFPVDITDQYSAPAITAPVTFEAELGYDDPIIEIVFEDGDPAPPPPPPIIDPGVFSIPEEPVEVYFIEYSPGDNIDDIKGLNLDGAQPGILSDLPKELPADVRSQLLDSGLLDDADVQVINLEDALTQNYLDKETREALLEVYGSESRRAERKVAAPSKEAVDVKVRRLVGDDNTSEGIAGLISGLGKFREGRFAGVVEANDEDSKKFLPVVVDGAKLPLPEELDLEGREVAGVLVLASGENDESPKPPANASDPEHNLVESASTLQPVVKEPDTAEERVDRQWNGDPNGWRPIWN